LLPSPCFNPPGLEISRRRNGVITAHILRMDDDIAHRAEDDAAWICAHRQEVDDVAFTPPAKRILPSSAIPGRPTQARLLQTAAGPAELAEYGAF
jgi:hypothetical protein